MTRPVAAIDDATPADRTRGQTAKPVSVAGGVRALYTQDMRLMRYIVFFLLLISLPLQGVAASLALPACTGSHAPEYRDGQHLQHEGNNHKRSSTGLADDQPHCQDDCSAAMGCCHHFYTTALPPTAPAGLKLPEVYLSRVSLLATLFIPDLPQRPPRR